MEEFEKKGSEGGSANKSKSKGRRGQGQEKVKRDDEVCSCAAEISSRSTGVDEDKRQATSKASRPGRAGRMEHTRKRTELWIGSAR